LEHDGTQGPGVKMQRDNPLVLHGDNTLQFGDKLEGKPR